MNPIVASPIFALLELADFEEIKLRSFTHKSCITRYKLSPATLV